MSPPSWPGEEAGAYQGPEDGPHVLLGKDGLEPGPAQDGGLVAEGLPAVLGDRGMVGGVMGAGLARDGCTQPWGAQGPEKGGHFEAVWRCLHPFFPRIRILQNRW